MLTPLPPSLLSQGPRPLPILSSFFTFLSKHSQEKIEVTRIAQRGRDHLYISMARDVPKFLYDQEEDYIDMDISSSTFFCYSPQSREFEFHMTNNLKEREVATSPADELFYKGKLLPLHLPPRLQMVQKLLQNTTTNDDRGMDSPELNYFTAAATPYASCNISPSESCHVSRELKPEDYMELKSGEEGSFMDQPKQSWSKKLKLIKQSSLGSKLKASRAYLKSLFTKSACSAEDAARNVQGFATSRPRELSNTYIKVAKKNPFGQIQRERYQVGSMDLRSVCKEKASSEVNGVHRRSFSGAIQRNHGVKPSPSPTSSSSSSSSSLSSSFSGYRSLNGLSSSQLLRRSSSGGSDVECSIQGAIAHCKQSQQLCYARKSVSDVGLCSLSASMIAACDKDWPGMCRG